MTLHVASARIAYRGPDRLDVTRKSGCALGRLFAPSWVILRPALDARARAKAVMQEAKRAASLPETMIRPSEWDLAREAEAIEAAAWEAYVPAFLEFPGMPAPRLVPAEAEDRPTKKRASGRGR